MTQKFTYHLNGRIKTETYENDQVHREDGPAMQMWNDQSQLIGEIWVLNGKLHRTDGPAHKVWYEGL